MAALSLAVGVVLGDSGVVTLALPEILRDFGAEVGEVAWVLIAFNLALAVVAVPAARVCVRGDPAAAMAGGLIGFVAATTVCVVAPSLGVLIAARAAQAAAGAVVIVGSLELLVETTGAERAGVRRWAAAGVAGAALGPVIGGLLTWAFSWRAIFVVQIPMVLWELHGAPERLTLDVDATLITAHSEKEQAAGNYKGGYGFHPLQVYLDETGEALGGLLRPGNAGSNTADDHVAVIDRALAQIPAEYVEGLEILVRADSAGATYGLVDYCREANMCFSVGYELTEQVRAAILTIPEDAWVRALDQDGSERENGEVCEITDTVDLSAWPEGCRLIVRRERPHPGGQLSFTDHDGYRFQAILTDQPDENIAVLECRHRQHAHVEDRIRDDKDTGLSKFPFKAFQLNEVWLEIVALAHDLLVWTQALILDGELAKAEPKRLRYRLLHVAARLAFSGRRAKLHLQNTWPWVTELKAAFERLKALPATAG